MAASKREVCRRVCPRRSQVLSVQRVELGVDVGGQGVRLRKFPGGKLYSRAGRAGVGRTQRPWLYCAQRRNHDLYYFQEPAH